METLAAAEEDEMVTVYHPDGARLRLRLETNHACRPKYPQARSKILNSLFIDATNMGDYADGHIHSLAIAFDGKDQMTHVWAWRQDGHNAPMTFSLKRKSSVERNAAC